MMPEIGDAVIYVKAEGVYCAAIVTRVPKTPAGGVADLHVMDWPAPRTPGDGIAGAIAQTMSIARLPGIPYSATPTPDTWCWPAEVPGSRAWRRERELEAMQARLDAIKKGDADG